MIVKNKKLNKITLLKNIVLNFTMNYYGMPMGFYGVPGQRIDYGLVGMASGQRYNGMEWTNYGSGVNYLTSERTILNNLVHANDTHGRYMSYPNPYRDGVFSQQQAQAHYNAVVDPNRYYTIYKNGSVKEFDQNLGEWF